MPDLILLKDFERTQIELWKAIDGYPGYEVSSLGRVRTFLKRRGNGRMFWDEIMPTPQRVLRPDTVGRYSMVTLGGRIGRQPRPRFKVHRLVAQAFLPNPENKLQVNHLTGYRHDCRLRGLEWNTSFENMQHCIRHKLRVEQRGSRHYAARLTEDKVLQIRALAASGSTHNQIAQEFNVVRETVTAVVNRHSWKHVA